MVGETDAKEDPGALTGHARQVGRQHLQVDLGDVVVVGRERPTLHLGQFF